jgi:hypothetical protein
MEAEVARKSEHEGNRNQDLMAEAESAARADASIPAGSTAETEPREPNRERATAALADLKDQMRKADPKRAVGYLKKKPALGVVIAGGLGFAAANVIGVGEIAIAMAAGYFAYRALTS